MDELKNKYDVDSLEKLNWALAKIGQANQRIAKKYQLAEYYKQRIEEWLEKAIKKDTYDMEYLQVCAEQFAKNEINAQYKKRSLDLPAGKVSLRKLPDKIEIKDEEIAIKELETKYPEAIKIKKSIDRQTLKKAMAENKQLFIEGIEYQEGEDKLYFDTTCATVPLDFEELDRIGEQIGDNEELEF